MVQRNTPGKLGIIASLKNYVKSSEVLYKTVKPSCQTSDIRSKGGGAELKKIMKKSRSIKRSEPEASGSYPARRSKPQPKKLPPRDILPVAAASPKKPSQQSTKVAPRDVEEPAATLKKPLAQSNKIAAIQVATPVGAAAFSTPKKPPSPSKLPEGSPNYMKSTTSSSNARRDRSQVSPQGAKTSFDSKSPCLNHRKLSRESGHKPDRTLTKTSSLRPVRTLTKTTSSKKKSGVSLYPDQNVERATCSSTLKDSKFPTYVMLHPGGTESEGTSVIKVCPYTYCSLNGHHHAQLPPLKHFMSARRRLLKTQKSMRQKNQSPNRIKRGGKRKQVDSNKCHIALDGDHHHTIPEADSSIFPQIEQVGLDYFVEIYAQQREDGGDFDAAIDEEDVGKNDENMSDESLHSEISFEYDLNRYSDFLVAEMDISMIFPDLPADDADLRGCAIGAGSKSTRAAESEDDEMIFETMDMDWEEGQVVDARLGLGLGLEADPAQTDDEPNLEAMSKCYEEVPPNEELQSVPAKNNKSLEAVIDDDVFSAEGGHHNSEIDLSSKVNNEEFILSNEESSQDNLSSDEDKFDQPIAADKDEFPDLEDSINTDVFSDPSEHPLEELNATYTETCGISQTIDDDWHQEEVLLQDDKSACSINIENDTQMEEKEECESLAEIEKDDTYSEDADAGHDQPQQQDHHENAEDRHEGMNLSISTCTFSEGQGDSERNKLKSVQGNKAGFEKNEPDDKVETDAAEEILIASDVTGAREEITITNAGECDSDQELPGSNSSTNRRIRCKRPTTDSDEPREFNPREPHFLPLVPDPEAEKVDLRHQMMDERKNAEEWMVDFALRQAVNKLAPARKRRVALLVEAFETVNPVPKYKSHLQHTTAAFTATRFIQACN